MSNTAMHLPKPHADESTHERRVGTFADGQRAVPVIVTCSAEVGSFGGRART